MVNRRSFLQTLGAATIGGLAVDARAFTGGSAGAWTLNRIGVQLYTLPLALDKDFEGTLRTLADTGYTEVELFGPYPFSAAIEVEGWKQTGARLGVSQSGYYGYRPAELKRLLDDVGLTAPSAHVGLLTLRTGLEQTLEAAREIGHEYVVCPFLATDDRSSIDAYRRLADEFNRIGAACKRAGLRFGYHNHSFEFGVLEEQIPYDVLLAHTDPDLVTMELDLFWIMTAGFDPVDYFKNYPGRFELCHVKDMETVQVPGDLLHTFEQPEALAPIIQGMRPVGRGVMDFARIFAHAAAAGLKHYFVEHDLAATPVESVQASYAYLSGLEIPGERT